MIESVLVDELRARMSEHVERAQFKPAPPAAEEAVASALARSSRRDGGRQLSASQARRMAAEMSAYDAELVKGGGPS